MLKPQHCVVRIPHHDDIAVRHLLPPRLHPEIENIVQVEIGKQRRYYCPLTRGADQAVGLLRN
jgi:hypothetical protein